MERVAASGWVRYGSYAILFAFLVFFAWEVLQTPFYKDDTTEINRIVWYRIHCTVGDGAVILGAMAITCVIRRRVVWLFVPRVTEYALVTIFGVAYTALSEYLNVRIVERWDYSGLMPQLLGVGLLPVAQWITLPTAIMKLASDHVRVETRGARIVN